ncbi:hypothetical protein CEQ90_03835 [Lewinellaceae bacterium SD302]|nr:hypothetical protein CEQ90_03835 [Lewinellaceae bacterium SD302]
MKKDDLAKLSIEELKAKEKSLKIFVGVFIILIILLFFFLIRAYLDGAALDWSIMTIAICSLGGPAALYPELKQVQAEIKARV